MSERRFRLKSCTEKAYAQILDSMEVIQLLFLFQRANALTDIKDPRADRSQGNSAEYGGRGFIRRVAASCAASEGRFLDSALRLMKPIAMLGSE
jgi:hypothetical protein